MNPLHKTSKKPNRLAFSPLRQALIPINTYHGAIINIYEVSDMNTKLVKKILIRLSLFALVITISSFIWVDYQLTGMYGGHVKVADYTQFKPQTGKIAISHVNVLSEDGKTMLKDKTIVLDNNKIISIGDELNLPKNTFIVNGEGKYLIPGLIDSHAHLNGSENDLLLYIANGVTYIREMKGNKDHLKLRAEINNGRIGPTLFVATHKVNNYAMVEGWINKWTRLEINIPKPENALSIIQDLAEEGYDAIKVGTFLNLETYQAVSEASKQTGITLLGHTPLYAELSDVWQSNQKEISHVEEIFKALEREFGYWESKTSDNFLPFVKKRSTQIANNLYKNKIKVTSTLWLMESILRQQEDIVTELKSIELVYANPGISEGTVLTSHGLAWLPGVNPFRYSPDTTPAERVAHIRYEKQKVQVLYILLKDMIKANVEILAGTDTTTPMVVAGFSMHDELESLTNSVMTPTQALASATRVPADWMQVKTGRVARGYQADLVLLNKNPLENIENIRSIDSVISNGQLFNRELLDDLLNAVKQANDESRTVDISDYL